MTTFPGGRPGWRHSGCWLERLVTEWGVVVWLWVRWRLVATTAAAIALAAALAAAARTAAPRKKGGKRPAEAAPQACGAAG